MKLKSSIQTIACAVLCISLFSCEGKNSKGMGGFAREYAVMTVQPSSMEWFSSYPARIKGKQDIEIRPNVSGFLTELLVDEGSLVKKGDVLFVIDTIPYKSALKVAEATVQSAKATAETADSRPRINVNCNKRASSANTIARWPKTTTHRLSPNWP